MTRVLVLNGPNLGSLGLREPRLYGSTTLHDIETAMRRRAGELGVEIRFEQTNHEGRMVDLLEEERGRSGAVIVNPGGLSHTSVVLLDALRAFGAPVIEVHLTNIHAREPYRRVSITAEAARGIIAGLGPEGYLLALTGLVSLLHPEGSEGTA